MTTWKDIINKPGWSDLDLETKYEVRRQWIQEDVAPLLADDPDREAVLKELWDEPLDTGEGALRSATSAFARGALRPLSDIPIAVGALTGAEGIEEFGKGIQSGIEDAFPVNPAKEGFFTTEIPGVGGQVGSILFGGLGGASIGGRLAGKAATQLAAKQAQKLGAKAAVGTQAFTGGAAGGAAAADQYGLTDGRKAARALLGGVTELGVEALPFGMLTETGPIRKLMGESIESGFMKPVLTGTGTEAVEEGLAETIGQATDIAFAPDQAQMDLKQIGKAMLLGGVGGAMFGGVQAAIAPQTAQAVNETGEFTRIRSTEELPQDVQDSIKRGESSRLVFDKKTGRIVGYRPATAAPAADTVEAEMPVEINVPEDQTGPEWISQRGLEKAAWARLNELRVKRDGEQLITPDGKVIQVNIPEYFKREEKEELEKLESLLEADEPDLRQVANIYGKKIKTATTVENEPPQQTAAKPTAQLPKPLERSESRRLVTEVDDFLQTLDPVTRIDKQNRFDRIKKRYQEAKLDLESATTAGDVRRAELDLMDEENALRRLMGREEVQTSLPITEADQQKEQARQEAAINELDAKISRGDRLTKSDQTTWSLAGRDKSQFPKDLLDPPNVDATAPTDVKQALEGMVTNVTNTPSASETAVALREVLAGDVESGLTEVPQPDMEADLLAGIPVREDTAAPTLVTEEIIPAQEDQAALEQQQPTETNVPLPQEALQQEQSRGQDMQEPRELPILPAEPTAQAPEAAVGDEVVANLPPNSKEAFESHWIKHVGSMSKASKDQVKAMDSEPFAIGSDFGLPVYTGTGPKNKPDKATYEENGAIHSRFPYNGSVISVMIGRENDIHFSSDGSLGLSGKGAFATMNAIIPELKKLLDIHSKYKPDSIYRFDANDARKVALFKRYADRSGFSIDGNTFRLNKDEAAVDTQAALDTQDEGIVEAGAAVNIPRDSADVKINAPKAEQQGKVVFQRPNGSRYTLLDNSKTPPEWQNAAGRTASLKGFGTNEGNEFSILPIEDTNFTIADASPEAPSGDSLYVLSEGARDIGVKSATELFREGWVLSPATAELEQQKATLPVDGEGAMLQGGEVRQEVESTEVTFDSFDPADGTIAEKTATAAEAMTELQAQREFLQKLLDCVNSK